ncbi:MAG: STAS domain-containing protein [Candidatus Rifleibacteriota bacterium]
MIAFDKTLDGQVAKFLIKGDFVQSSSSEILRKALLDTIRSGITTIRIDLRDADHIDSPSIGLLVSAHNSLRSVSGELIVDQVKPQLAELFSVLQLDKRFKINQVQEKQA